METEVITAAQGVGLAHGGDLTLDKTDSNGTRFRIVLPNPRQTINNRATASAEGS